MEGGDKLAQEDVGRRRERRFLRSFSFFFFSLFRLDLDKSEGGRESVERFKEKLHVCLPGGSRYTHFIGIHHGKDTQGRH